MPVCLIVRRSLAPLAVLATLAACSDTTADPALAPAADDLALARGAPTAVTVIGSLDGRASTAFALNDRGVVVGASSYAGGGDFDRHAFRWTAESGLVDLGTLGGAFSAATSVNRAGWIAGFATTPDGVEHLVLWTPEGAMRDLGAPQDTRIFSAAINDRNAIAVTACPVDVLAPFNCRAYVWAESTGFTLAAPELAGESYAGDINREGGVTGTFCCGTATFYGAFLTRRAGFVDVGAPSGENGEGNGLNDRGWVVGSEQRFETTGDVIAPFVWRPRGGFQLLENLGGTDGYANDVNDRGEVVGASTPGDCCVRNAFYWSERAGLVNLGGPGSAEAINESGEVAGSLAGQAVLWRQSRNGNRASTAAAAIARAGEAGIAAAGRLNPCLADRQVAASRPRTLRCMADLSRAAR